MLDYSMRWIFPILYTIFLIIYIITKTLRSLIRISQESFPLLLFHLFQDNGITATGFIAPTKTIIAV